ncbi:MAG TPA: ABC transporter permease [Marmoricola sp.]|jgi:branched-chain amino acid transport system permease protein|nr:ABC transporter permease [Marmoricola sp.]
MGSFLSFTFIGLFTGAAYAIAASGLVLTYSTTRVFNIAHGAFGMVLAFVYWDLSQRQGIPAWVSLVVVLLLVAPATGFLVQRTVTKGLGRAPVGVSLVVTVGLLVGLVGVATQVWPPAARTVPPFFEGKGFTIGSVTMTYHQLLTIVLSGVVAAALYLLLNRTRVGTAMRASVDNPELLELYGGRPNLVAGLAWAIGIALAALGGILLAPTIGLQYYDLTLLVISAYAAAMLGKLTDLRLSYIGAMVLGILQSYAVGYLPSTGTFGGVRAVVPTLFLFAVILLMPQAPLRVGQVKGLISAPVPRMSVAAGWGGALVLGVAVFAFFTAGSTQLLVGTAATYAIVMLSMVLLTGYGGHVSLAQFTFAGVGALVYARYDHPTLWGLLVAVVATAIVGALVALPVLRLTGLYLALATLAFAQLMDKLVFQDGFSPNDAGVLAAKRLSFLGLSAADTGVYTVVMTIFFVAVALLVIAVRRGRVGRMLIAMRDSQAACGTLGLDLRWWRVGLFAASAGIAGLAGALFAGLRQTVGAADFQFFASLLLLLVAVVWGVTSVTGALIGGVFLMELPVVQSTYPALGGLAFAVIGFGAVALGRDPNGLANRLFQLGNWLRGRVLGMVRNVGDMDLTPTRAPGPGPEEVPAHAVAQR